jgi:hypothetical protein
VSEVAANRIRDADATFHVEHALCHLCRPAPCISGETKTPDIRAVNRAGDGCRLTVGIRSSMSNRVMPWNLVEWSSGRHTICWDPCGHHQSRSVGEWLVVVSLTAPRRHLAAVRQSARTECGSSDRLLGGMRCVHWGRWDLGTDTSHKGLSNPCLEVMFHVERAGDHRNSACRGE